MNSCEIIIYQPDIKGENPDWLFANLPQSASESLSSRGLVTVDCVISQHAFSTTLQPDGQGGHWLRLESRIINVALLKPHDRIEFRFQAIEIEPEPEIPEDIQIALNSNPDSMETWLKTTAISRRDWIHWITSGKKAETRIKRIDTAMDMLRKGKKRACCFDRSGMYSKSLSSPKAQLKQTPS